MILEQIEVTMMSVFCYILGEENSREGLLIDPAGDLDRVFEKVNGHGLSIRYIVNTHGHWDHTSGNDEAVKRSGAQILIHKADTPGLRKLGSRVFSRVLGGKASPEPFRLLADGDVIELGTLRLKVIHTPGHTPGGICLLAEDNLFTGDTLFTEGFGRTDLPGGSHKTLMDS
ncbi:MAG TPA: MBL fold metallo-hydrolase, partial [Spirochaetes bacterium]|nr:MBL fold metallo-hydrolase [Spirochaetota bacterium]